MKKLLNRRMKGTKGFTLTELIVVVAILGILAAVAVPSVLSYVDSARVQADNSNAATIENIVARQIAKGTIVLTGGSKTGDAAIVTAVKTEMPTIPSCQQGATYDFVLTRATGKVTVTTTDPVADTTVDIK